MKKLIQKKTYKNTIVQTGKIIKIQCYTGKPKSESHKIFFFFFKLRQNTLEITIKKQIKATTPN